MINCLMVARPTRVKTDIDQSPYGPDVVYKQLRAEEGLFLDPSLLGPIDSD